MDLRPAKELIEATCEEEAYLNASSAETNHPCSRQHDLLGTCTWQRRELEFNGGDVTLKTACLEALTSAVKEAFHISFKLQLPVVALEEDRVRMRPMKVCQFRVRHMCHRLTVSGCSAEPDNALLQSDSGVGPRIQNVPGRTNAATYGERPSFIFSCYS